MPETLFSRTTYQYCKYSHASKLLVDQYICLFVNIEIKTLGWHIKQSGVVLKTIITACIAW